MISLLVYKCGSRGRSGHQADGPMKMSLLNNHETRTDRQQLLAGSGDIEANNSYNGYASLDEYEEDSLFTAPPTANNKL